MDNLPREPDLTDNDTRRTMWDTYSPIALFASAPEFTTGRNHLVPVAIQMDFKPGLVYLIYHPLYSSQCTYSYLVNYCLKQPTINTCSSMSLITWVKTMCLIFRIPQNCVCVCITTRLKNNHIWWRQTENEKHLTKSPNGKKTKYPNEVKQSEETFPVIELYKVHILIGIN